VRWFGILGVCAVLAADSVGATDEKRPCLGSLEVNGRPDGWETPDRQTLLTDDQCEALQTHKIRVPLLQIPQENEDPMDLSLDAKDSGGTLRFKIPFSF
jgi:hypothetical protein